MLVLATELSGEWVMQEGPVVLVVEDDPQMQVLVEEVLKDAGFGCLITTSGEEANNLLVEGIGKYCALVTDIKLSGGIDGWKVGRCVRELNQYIPVIYMTGDSAEKWASCGVPHSIILNKPFALAQVVTAVAQPLNTSGSSNGVAQTGQAST
jgi:DNA-binding NtrC family response regulator